MLARSARRSELLRQERSGARGGLGPLRHDRGIAPALRDRREFAPYTGVERDLQTGATADLAREAGGRAAETRYLAGLRFWF
jgi:copper resistance protein B